VNEFDDQLRAEMRHATEGVQAPDGLAAAAGAGGRRRLRRRRAVQTAPVAAAIAGIALLAPQLGGRGPAPVGTVAGAQGAEPLEATTALAPTATPTTSSAPTSSAPTSSAPTGGPTSSADETFVVPDSWPAYFAAGYDYDDAVVLAGLWHTASVEDAKTRAGQELITGKTLPIAPGSAPAAPDSGSSASGTAPTAEDAAVTAFFAAGYDYADAVTLAGLWGGDPYEAKVSAGQKLLAGATLPVAP